jgi:hypothetical protein
MGLDPRQQHGGFLVARGKKNCCRPAAKTLRPDPMLATLLFPHLKATNLQSQSQARSYAHGFGYECYNRLSKKKNFHASVENVESDLGAAAAAAATVVGAPRLRPPSRRFRWLP